MKWLKELYVGEKAQAKAKSLLRTAERGKKSKSDKCYLITLSSYPGIFSGIGVTYPFTGDSD